MTLTLKLLFRIPVLVFAASICGCGGGSGEPRGAVSGNVTMDGQPVELGQITFTPTGKTGTVTGAEIKGGKYSIPKVDGPVVGGHKVSIRASKKTGQQIPAIPPADPKTMIDVMVEYIPTKYNFETTLTTDIKAGDNKDVNFALTN